MANAKLIIEFFHHEAPQLNIDQDALKDPKPDQIIQAYHFLCELIFEDMEVAKSIDAGSQAMVRPLMIIRTQQYVNMVFNRIFEGDNEFLYTDLLRPEPRRTNFLLAHLIRFYNMKCDLAKHQQAVDNEIEERVRAFDFEKTCEQKTTDSLQKCKELLGQLENKKNDLQSKEPRIKEKLDAKRVEADNEKKNIGLIREVVTKAQQTLEEHQQMVSQEEDNQRRLEMNIVNSPDRIIGELEAMEADLANTRHKHDLAIQESRKLDRDLAEQKLTWQCMEGLTSELRKLDSVQDRMLELRGQEEERRKQLNELDLMRKGLEAELEKLERQAENDINSLEGEVQGQRKAMEALKQQQTQLESAEKEMSKRLAAVKEEIKRHQQSIKKKERSFAVARDTYDDALATMCTKVKKLEDKVAEHQAGLNKLLDKVRSIYGLPRGE